MIMEDAMEAATTSKEKGMAGSEQIRTGKVALVQADPTPQGKRPPASIAGSPIFLPALATGAILWLCYFPLNWGWLSWIAMVPFLGLVRAKASSKRLFWAAYLGGSAFFWPAISWMPVADSRMYATWAMLATYCAFYFPAALVFTRLLDRRTFLPLCLSFPLVWTALEWVRSFLLTGFAWYYLGHTQHDWLSMIQIADLGGVYAVSFLVAMVNAWLFDFLYQMPAVRDAFRWEEPSKPSAKEAPPSGFRLGLLVELAVVFAVLITAYSYGSWRLDQEKNFVAGPRIALLQGNQDQRIRNEADNPGTNALQLTARHYAPLTTVAMKQRPDLIVWPETAYPAHWFAVETKEVPPQAWVERCLEIEHHLKNELLRFCPTNHLLGISSLVLDDGLKERRYNSALLLSDKGDLSHRFDKMHRVPFGEYVPLRDVLPFMDKLAPYDYDYSLTPGKKFTRFPLGEFRFGALICYEDTDPFLARRYAVKDADGEPVHFLVNQSNDGWFDGSSEHEEHLVVARFRAIEARRALVRAVNMGVSAVVDSNGRVLKPTKLPPVDPEFRTETSRVTQWQIAPDAKGRIESLPPSEWRDFKKQAGVLFATVPIDFRSSIYAEWGDVLPQFGWCVIGLAFAWSLIRRSKDEPRPGHAPV
jgi:apolipoprotein N-acyltransferase